jgi:hypothetical protein
MPFLKHPAHHTVSSLVVPGENTYFLLPSLWVILERYTQAKEIYQEALKRAELKRDEVSVQHIREELAELSRKSRRLT